MANDLNQCHFIGRLGADPETRYAASGTAVTRIRIACGWKSKDKEGVEWVPVVFFGRLSEVASQYLRKGSQVYISGRFTTQSWEQDGQKRYRSEVVADRLQMLGSAPDRSESRSSGYEQPAGGGYQRPSSGPTLPEDDDFDDDIPF